MLKLRETVSIDGRYAVVEIEIDEKEIAWAMASRVRQASQRKGRPVAASALWGAVRAQVLKPTVTMGVRPLDDPRPATSAAATMLTPTPAVDMTPGTYTNASDVTAEQVEAAHKQIQEAFESDDEPQYPVGMTSVNARLFFKQGLQAAKRSNSDKD